MTWNNVYLSTPTPVGNYQGSAATAVFSGISLTGALQGEVASASAISGAAVTGTNFTGSQYSVAKSGNTLFGGFFSGQTSGWGSLTSTAVADGELSIVSLSALSCILAYRSGSTVYKFFARQAEGLSTTP